MQYDHSFILGVSPVLTYQNFDFEPCANADLCPSDVSFHNRHENQRCSAKMGSALTQSDNTNNLRGQIMVFSRPCDVIA